MILGMGKYGTQELMLRKYIAGDFDYVRAFQNRQIELTKGLYDLARFVSLEAFSMPSEAIPAVSSSLESPQSQGNPGIVGNKQCPSCFANNPLSAKECEIGRAAI